MKILMMSGAMCVNISQKDLTQRRQGAEIYVEFANCVQNSASLRLREREFEIMLMSMMSGAAI